MAGGAVMTLAVEIELMVPEVGVCLVCSIEFYLVVESSL